MIYIKKYLFKFMNFQNTFVNLLVLCFLTACSFQSQFLTANSAEMEKLREEKFVDLNLKNMKPKMIIDLIQKNCSYCEKEIISLFRSPLGYTLIGEKPISFEETFLDQKVLSSLTKTFSDSEEYVFKIVPDGSEKKEICLIHKKRFFELCEKENLIICFLRKKHLSAQEFLRKFKKSKVSFSNFCDNDDTVIGTFLGFGSQNAVHWYRWARLGFFLGAWPFKQPSSHPSPWMIGMSLPCVRVPNMINIPKENLEFRSLYSEWNWLNSRVRSCNELNPPPFLIQLPAFFYWEGSEEPVHRFIQARDILGAVLYTRSN